jgi:hypothetical protein
MQQQHRTPRRALVIPVRGPVETIELNGGLEQLHAIVGGLVQALPLPEAIDRDQRATVYINEEGKLDPDAKPNMRATDFMVPGVGLFLGDYIVGPMIVAGFDPRTGEHTELPPAVERRVRLIEREAGDTECRDVAAWVVEFIEASAWTTAQSGDHAYTVKARSPDRVTFERLVAYVREHGYERSFAGRTYVYLDVGEHRYWSMGTHSPELTTILNRAENAEER